MTQGTEFPACKGEQYDRDASDGNSASEAVNTEEHALQEELESIIDYEALYWSMRKCTKGVLWKDSVASFRLNSIEKIIKLSDRLHDGSYKAQPPVLFSITSPKPREIASVAFTDRVYQRSLNDNVVYPIMTRSFILDNYACQKGKGTDAARNRLKDFLHKYFRKYGTAGFVAQFDIHGYYPNMDHAITEDIFRTKLRPEIYEKVETILREQYPGDTGYNPGSQLIQIAGISVLDGMDHYIKEKLHAKFYIRYMDDFLIFHPDRSYVEKCIKNVTEYLTNLRFEINPDKTRIFSIDEGIDFLGFNFQLTNTGKVLMLIKSENVKRERKKLRRLVHRSKRGLIPKEKVRESYDAWRNHASKGNSFHLIQRMDSYYKNLWKE